jgi:hypothetical protein
MQQKKKKKKKKKKPPPTTSGRKISFFFFFFFFFFFLFFFFFFFKYFYFSFLFVVPPATMSDGGGGNSSVGAGDADRAREESGADGGSGDVGAGSRNGSSGHGEYEDDVGGGSGLDAGGFPQDDDAGSGAGSALGSAAGSGSAAALGSAAGSARGSGVGFDRGGASGDDESDHHGGRSGEPYGDDDGGGSALPAGPEAEAAALQIQSVVRGRLARRHVDDLRSGHDGGGSGGGGGTDLPAGARSQRTHSRSAGGTGGGGGGSRDGSHDGRSRADSRDESHDGVSNAARATTGPIVPVGEEGLSDYDEDEPIVPVGEEGLDEFDGPYDDGDDDADRFRTGGADRSGSRSGGSAGDPDGYLSDEDLVARQAQLVAQYDEDEEEEDLGPTFEELMHLYEEAMAERERQQLLSQLLHKRVHEHLSRRKQLEEKREPDAKALAELEQQYARTLSAIDEQHAVLERNQAMYDRVAGDMKDRVAERNQKAEDLRGEVRAFKRDVCSQAENSRTGKPIPQREVAAFEERDAEREEELSVVRLRNIALRNQLSKLEGQLRAREELADGLHLIDFEQLKIENATFNEKIEEREEELLKLRHKISKTVIIVSHAKEKLQFTMAANADLRIELAELETEVTRGRDTLNKIKQERDALRSDNLAIRKNGSRISTEELAKDFELGKDSLAGMRTVFADLKARHTDLTERIARLEQANGAARMNHTVGLNRTGGGFN